MDYRDLTIQTLAGIIRYCGEEKIAMIKEKQTAMVVKNGSITIGELENLLEIVGPDYCRKLKKDKMLNKK